MPTDVFGTDEDAANTLPKPLSYVARRDGCPSWKSQRHYRFLFVVPPVTPYSNDVGAGAPHEHLAQIISSGKQVALEGQLSDDALKQLFPDDE
jgi:hypothetical protein